MTVADTQTIVADVQEGTSCQTQSVCVTSIPSIRNTYHSLGQTKVSSTEQHRDMWSYRFHSTPLGESPPPAPRGCFGRNGLIDKVVGFSENLEPVALIGAGGIGKTSIALSVLHHDRIKERFGENRRFIRCDQFPASRAHFLARLSEAIGAGVENPEDLAPLRPFLSSREMILILDCAESILDPKGPNARDIYPVVDELSQFKTICLLITSRITTVPPCCRRPGIPTLSMEAASDIFYGIYSDHGRSSIINDLLGRLDFHPLSIKLLATTASHNAWDYDRLAREWDAQRAQVLQTGYNENLAANIELSLASPTFHSLGTKARELLGVVAFFPQGLNENNLDWLFPTVSNRNDIFDKFCVLSLTYRSNGFITMLSPIRDYLSPPGPQLSPLLCTTRDHYFRRLSVDISPDVPGFEEARWIVLEDANVEHLLNVFTPIDLDKDYVWEACHHFMDHLYWHKPRQTMLGSKIEALPDDHRYKPKCLSQLSRLMGQVGSYPEQKRLLTQTLALEKRMGDNSLVAHTLRQLSDVNRNLNLYEEGVQKGKEALGICERAGDKAGQIQCLSQLTWLLLAVKRLKTAEVTTSHTINIVTEKGQEHLACQLRWVLGKICRSKGEEEKAIHFGTSIKAASPFDWHDALYWIHFDLASLFRDAGKFEDTNSHVEQAKSHTVNDAYKLVRVMELQASLWYQQPGLKGVKWEALHALEIYERPGVEKALQNQSSSLQGELPE